MLTLLLTLAGIMLFANLEGMYVELYDEARHAVNAYEMIQNDDYLVNTYWGAPDYSNLKPPLSMWSIVLGYKLFGYTLAAIRIPSAASMLLMMLAVAVWMKRRFGSVASLSALGALMAMEAVIAGHYARYADPDALYQLFFTISMLCILDSERDFRWFYGSAISFGLAFMVKSWHALCIPAICLAYVLCNRRKKELTWKRAGLLLLAGFAPVLPWMAARFMRDGVTFLLGTVTTDVMQRVSDMQMGTSLEYPRYLLSQPMLVVSLTLSGAAYALLRFGMREKLPDGSRAAVRGCLLWLLVPPILYSFSSFKMHHYVFSSLTAGSVLLGVTLHALYLSARKKPDWRRGALGVLTAVACAVGIGWNLHTVLTTQNNHHYQVAFMELLNREDYRDAHLYIQY